MKSVTTAVTSFGTLLFAVVLSTIGAIVILKNLPFLPESRSWITDGIVAISFGTAITSAFYTSFHRGIFLKRINPFSDPKSLAPEIALVQSIIALLFLNHKVPETIFYVSVVALQTWATWLSFEISRDGINVNHRLIKRLPWFAAAAVAIFGFLAWPVRNFWSMESLLVASLIWQAIVHIALHVGVLSWFSYQSDYRLPQQNFLNCARLRLKNDGSIFSVWMTSLVAGFIQLFSVLCVIYFSTTNDHTDSLILTTATQFLFLPSLLEAWSRLEHLGSSQENLIALSRLTVQSARKLIMRHNHHSDSWAATVGLRTSAFTVDHDPDSIVSSRVPATLLRIRNEEILGFVSQLTKQHALSTSSISQKIIGSIDPEHSVRPCVDVLNLCATLYLDAGPMVERRITGLVSLLPIVNPGLAEAINMNHLLPMLKRNQWFFHFDYAWVDQSIINTPGAARYGIHLDPVTPEARIAMLEHMRKTHSVGNFIWVGKDAHERLLQEAPYIASIMEANIIKMNREQEALVFSIKFEQLIPRLQRYYGLDRVRSKVIDYEPSSEAQRLLQLLSFQTQHATTTLAKRRIIESIASYKWHGFKEKDQALKLLLQIHHAETENLSSSTPHKWSKSNDVMIESLRAAVTRIGYPSQIMNQAHVYKIQLRDIAKLRAHALNTASMRFEESWVLLGNLDYRRFGVDEIQRIREIIGDALRNPVIMKSTVVQSKIIDSTVALIRCANLDQKSTDLKLFTKAFDGIVSTSSNEDCIVLALDSLIFITQMENTVVPLSKTTIEYMDNKTAAEDSSNLGWPQTVRSRWQEHRSRFTPSNQSSPKAS